MHEEALQKGCVFNLWDLFLTKALVWVLQKAILSKQPSVGRDASPPSSKGIS